MVRPNIRKALAWFVAGLLLTGCLGPQVTRLDYPGVSWLGPPKQENPVWSPDGSKIAGSGQVHGGDVTPVGSISILDVVSGKHEWLLEAHNAYCWVQSWSPDGKEIAYSDTQSIWAVSAVGNGEPRFLSHGQLAAWSPTGKEMAIGESVRGTAQIWILDLESGAKRLVFTRSGGYALGWQLDWSPDGTRLAFAAGEWGAGGWGDQDVYVLDLATGTLEQLTDGGQNRHPTWSPDGRMIAYVARDARDNVEALVIARADGSCRVNALEVAEFGHFSGTDWAPNGTKIAFSWSIQLYLLDIAAVLGQDFLSTGPVCP